MGCCGGRDRNEKISDTQKWDYINLSDFKSSTCIAPFSYVVLYILLIVSVACYVVDMFTAVQLLIFDRWSGRIQPAISLNISRWIFLGCIIASYIFLAYRWWRAIRAIKSGGIAQSYLDPLAVRIQSVRIGSKGRGWRRFMVFAEMTRGKKGADTIALFTYFSFEAWYRIVFAEAPRNVINAVTIYSVFKADLIPHDTKSSMSPIMQFLTNVKILADGDYIRAAVLVGMLFVLITWSIAALSLLLSCFFYVCFLWNHVRKSDKSLRSFCKRRIDTRLSKIVDEKVDKALMKADAKVTKAGLKAGWSGEGIADIRKAPTLPNLEPDAGDMLPAMPLARQNSNMTAFSSVPSAFDRQGTPGPPALNRMDTNRSNSSAQSYGSNAPLMGGAAMMGAGLPPRPYSPVPPVPYLSGPSRSFSPAPGSGPPRSYSPAPSSGPPRSYSPAPSPGYPSAPPSRIGSEQSGGPRSFTPGGRQAFHVGAPPGPLTRQNTQGSSMNGSLISPTEPGYGPGPLPGGHLARQGTGMSNLSGQGRSSPAPGYRPQQIQEFEMRSQTVPPRAATSSPFQAFPPMARSLTSPQGQPMQRRMRNCRAPAPPGPPRGKWGAPPGPTPSSYDDSIYDHY